MNYNNHYNNNSKIVGQRVGRMNNINNNYIKPKRNNNKVIIEKVNYQPIMKSKNSHNYNSKNPININMAQSKQIKRPQSANKISGGMIKKILNK